MKNRISSHDLRQHINELNEELDLEVHIKRIVFWSRDYAEYEYCEGNTGIIKINPYQKFNDILEDLYHELAHAILHQCRVPRKYLAVFRETSPSIGQSRFDKYEFQKDVPPPEGYVSWYSIVNGTEEFCELFSAWACSGYKIKGRIDYSGWSHSIEKEKNLKKKILQLQRIFRKR